MRDTMIVMATLDITVHTVVNAGLEAIRPRHTSVVSRVFHTRNPGAGSGISSVEYRFKQVLRILLANWYRLTLVVSQSP